MCVCVGGLRSLSMLFWQATSVTNFRTFTLLVTGTFANSEDPDIVPQNGAFHQASR